MPESMLPKDVSLPSVRTLKTDTAEPAPVPAPVSIPERTVYPAPPVAAPSHHVRNLSITLLSVIVVAASGYGILKTAKQKAAEPPVQVAPITEARELLTYNTLIPIEFSNDELNDKEALGKSLSTKALTEEEGITFYKTNISIKRLLSLLSPSVPSEYMRSLDEKGFFGGSTQGNFFILKTDSPEFAVGSSLKWEQTMKGDLFPFFRIPSTAKVGNFRDEIVSNIDTRAALDDKGNILFLYGFHDSNTIIFAQNKQVFTNARDVLQRENL